MLSYIPEQTTVHSTAKVTNVFAKKQLEEEPEEESPCLMPRDTDIPEVKQTKLWLAS